jgi:hypothetical protein
MATTPKSWLDRAKDRLSDFKMLSADIGRWRSADAETIRWSVKGKSPYSGKIKPEGSAKIVFNIASAHVPSFVGSGYLNRYDIKPGIGFDPRTGRPDARARIDELLAALVGTPPAKSEELYYGAVELNGTGIRYYGDVCLVLKQAASDDDTLLLDRNSFDLICQPLRADTHDSFDTWDPVAAATVADGISGRLRSDLPDMAVCKVLTPERTGLRRMTIGSISQGVLADEDYMEVIRTGSFVAADLDEARVAAADAASDGLVGDRLLWGPTPDWAELLYRHRRRKADERLRTAGVRTRIVISSGRTRA